MLHFNPRSPSGLRLHNYPYMYGKGDDFNPRSPSGLRPSMPVLHSSAENFNPRSPSGLRLTDIWEKGNVIIDFNPRSPSGLRLVPVLICQLGLVFQSTQPEWAATLSSLYVNKYLPVRFQSTQPEWAATEAACKTSTHLEFQSTQPEWAATCGPKHRRYCGGYFNPRSPNGLRRGSGTDLSAWFGISIHAARMGCDR